MRVFRYVWIFTTAASVGACSGDDEFDCHLLPVCNIRERGCQEQIYQATACARDQEAGKMPVVRSISVDALEEELRASIAQSMMPEFSPWEGALRSFALIPEMSFVDVAVESTLSNVAAYYDTSNKQITIVEGSVLRDREQASWILSHEFVHALQDQDVDLDAFQARWEDSTDKSAAVSSLVEGEAMLLPNVLQVRRVGIGPERVDWNAYGDRLLGSLLETVEEAPSAFFDAFRLLPYAVGFRFVVPRWLVGGQSAIRALYDAPVLSLAEWASSYGNRQPGPPEPLTCYPTAAPPDFQAADQDSLGVAGLLGLYVELGYSGRAAFNLSASIRGDSMVLFTHAPEPSSEGVAAAWRIRFEDESSAAFLVEELEAAFDTRAGAILVERFEREVLLRAAPDPSVLAAWTNASECGRVEDLPAAQQPASRGAAARIAPARLQLLAPLMRTRPAAPPAPF